MKHKYFVIVWIFSAFLTGCNIAPYQEKEEVLVSKILKSQQALSQANFEPQHLTSAYIPYTQNYYFDSQLHDGITSTQLHIGDMAISGFGYNRFTLSDIILDFDVDTLNQDYLYTYGGYIYDDYHDRYHFDTSLPFVGKAHNTPYKGVMRISGEFEDIVVSVLDDIYVDIHIYDHYNSYHDRVIHSTWQALGF
jgi:hypothetical protein